MKIQYVNLNLGMKRSRTVIFIVILQIVFGLIILDYQFNPHKLRSQCVTALATSDNFGSGDIVDCVACHTFSQRTLKDKFIGRISILIPKKLKQNKIHSNQGFEQMQIENNGVHSRFLYLADVFTQKGCSYYECSSLQILQDFKMHEDYSIQILKKNRIYQQKEVIFDVSNKSLIQFIHNNDKYAFRLTSNSIIKEDIGSLAIRTRYSLQQTIQKNHSPSILVHELNTSIYVRFIIIMVPLLLSFNLLLSFIAQSNQLIKVILVLLLSIGFVSQNTAILSSSVAIYYVVAKIYKLEIYGIVTALAFLLIGFAASLNYVFAFISLFIFGLILQESRHLFSWKYIIALVAILINTIEMRMAKWEFYIYITPVILLAAVLTINFEKQTQPIKYDQINPDEKAQLSKANLQSP